MRPASRAEPPNGGRRQRGEAKRPEAAPASEATIRLPRRAVLALPLAAAAGAPAAVPVPA